MGYPQNIDSFSNKLNKIDSNTYVIEEIIDLKDGAYEGELQHDNISLTSINVYTGSKLTGTKVKNFIISTPSFTPWKTNIKVFSDISPVYITYETTGDTVEADDINKVQDSIVQVETEIDRYKNSNDTRASALENNKVDKITGKQLSTEDYTTAEKNKLAGIEAKANNYVHPLNHPAAMITEDTAHRWTTDTEKSNWNDANSKKHTHSNLSLLEAITQKVIDTWNSAVTHISDTVKHVTPDERTFWNTVSSKADTKHIHDDRYYTEAESDSKFATKDDLGKSGLGDMVKAVYDTNNDGRVDNADDANTVGGKSVSDMVTRLAARLENVDLNTIYAGGFYAVKNICSNIPINSDGYLLISSWNVAPWCAQIFIADDKTGTMFKRVVIGMNGSTPLWCDWKKVLTNKTAITWNDLKGV